MLVEFSIFDMGKYVWSRGEEVEVELKYVGVRIFGDREGYKKINI